MRPRSRILALLAPCTIAAVGAFAWTGLETSWRTPESGTTEQPEVSAREEVVLMAWNLAKCSFHRGGLRFRSSAEVRAHLDRIADVVRRKEVDLLFLSEVVFEGGPVPLNQVSYLAE